MKPTLEQIKIDESVWPEGATHFIDPDFQKWVGGEEYCRKHGAGEWTAEYVSWTKEEYAERGYKIIPCPSKTEREMAIEQAHKELGGLGLTAHLNILYDAGMLRLKDPTK